jgi:hypothetical protein
MTERSLFASKGVKKPLVESRTTLDNLHTNQINTLIKEKESLKKLEKEIEELEKEIENTNDIILKTQKEDLYESLLRKKKEIKEDKPIYDYFFETGDILYKYYEIQDKINKGTQTATRQIKAKPGSILAALQEGEEEEKPISKKHTNLEGREQLMDKYLQKIDPGSVKSETTNLEEPYGMCDACDKEMMFSANEALFYCDTCGNQEFVLIDSDKPSYKDPPREITYYAYKRINHFNESLAQFQAKESTEIPDDVFEAILDELKKERITNTENLKATKIREILKKLKLTNYYEHVHYILNRLNGKKAPIMTREVEEKLRFMFKEIQGSFIKHCPKSRSNFLSYSYVLYKFCELLELDDYLDCFPLLKNRDKLYNQDKIWNLICDDLGWQYIRSL